MAIDPLKELMPVASLVSNELQSGASGSGFSDVHRIGACGQATALLRLDRQRQRASRGNLNRGSAAPAILHHRWRGRGL
jgi:hypothetical protein